MSKAEQERRQDKELAEAVRSKERAAAQAKKWDRALGEGRN